MTPTQPLTFQGWLYWQQAVWLRWSRRTGAPCTPEVVRAFAARFAERHADCRYRAAA